jgi:hypothetical protein
MGEPLRSSHTQRAMAALLASHGFAIARDEGLPEIGAAMPAEVARVTRKMKHLRIVTAVRGGR